MGEGDWTELMVAALDRLKVRGAGLPANDGEGGGGGRHRPAAAAAAMCEARYDE